ARDWGWRSAKRSSSTTRGGSKCRARWAKARLLGSCCPSLKATGGITEFITQLEVDYLFPGLSPHGGATAPQAFHLALLALLLQHVADHVHAHAGTVALKMRHAEFSDHPFDRVHDELTLLSRRCLHLSHPLLKL